jgi:hypothetical protein
VEGPSAGSPARTLSPLMPDPLDLPALLHRLNNELGVLLAHAELLEAKVPDPASQARAAQVVKSTLEAMTTLREIRQQLPPQPEELDA